MPRFAANLSMMFTEVPFPQRFAAAARAGFTHVEFLFPYDHTPEDVAGWIRDAGVTNIGLNLYPGHWADGERGLTSLPGREDAFRVSVKRALEYAVATSTPTLHAMAGVVASGGDRAAYRRTYIANLKFAAAEAAKQGRVLLIEAINTRDIPGYFLNTQADAHAIRDEVDAPNLRVQMDFYHAQIVEGDITTTFKKYFDHIAHVQIAGVPDRHEPDEGEVNYRHIFRMLDETGYTGFVGCEYRPRAGTEAGLGWLKTLTGGT